MKRKVYLLVFNEMSDWETPYALWAIAKSGKFDIVPVGFSQEPVKSRCGLTILPDVSINDVEINETALFIVPGGDMWEQSFPETINLFKRLSESNVPMAAICGGTLEVVRAGLAHCKHHTSNDLSCVRAFVSDYKDESFYSSEPAVTDENLITANGLSPIEFGREIVKLLGIYNDEDAEKWFTMCKHGVYWKDF